MPISNYSLLLILNTDIPSHAIKGNVGLVGLDSYLLFGIVLVSCYASIDKCVWFQMYNAKFVTGAGRILTLIVARDTEPLATINESNDRFINNVIIEGSLV